MQCDQGCERCEGVWRYEGVRRWQVCVGDARGVGGCEGVK